jgi:hypothetical protein
MKKFLRWRKVNIFDSSGKKKNLKRKRRRLERTYLISQKENFGYLCALFE